MSGSVTATGRKRAAHIGPERRRPEVLDASLPLFLERGYEGTSMEAIAQAAGVTKPVVYACFASKDELFTAMLDREEGRIRGEIQSAFARTDLSETEATLIEGCTTFLRAVASSPDVYRLVFLGEGGGNVAVAKRIAAVRLAQVEALTALTRQWVRGRHKELSASEADARARLLGSSIVGLAEASARLMLSDPDVWTPEDLGRETGRLAAAVAAAV